MSRKLMLVFSLVIIASMFLAACQPQEIIKTVTVEKEVIKTVEVEKNVIQTQIVKEQVVTTVEVEKPDEPVVSFSTPHPILGELKVRQALAYCTNKPELIAAVFPLLSAEEQQELVMDTFIPKSHWAYAGDENVTIYPYDPAKGAALLDEAGWTLAEGADFRSNAAGDTLSLRFTTTSAAFRQTWAAVFEQQMAACGVSIVRLHAPASWWFGDTTGLARRDYELGAFAWVGQADPGGQTLYACDQIPAPENGWVGQNGMGWCNEAASKNIKLANNTLLKQERVDAYTIVQQEFTKDVPSIPLFNRIEVYAYAADFQNFQTFAGDSYYTWNAYDWEIPGTDTIVIGFTQEPASLFALVEDAQVARQAVALVGGFVNTGHNYDFQPRMQTPLSTIENGLAVNNDVEVKAGDMVLSAAGDPVKLEAGMMVKDNTGAEVEFTGTPIKMKQLVVSYKFQEGLKFSDGEPLKKADFELGYKITCDRESGATSFITCDQTQAITFDSDTQYTVTWLPGVQSPTYYLAPYGWYASHRVIESGDHAGKTLAEVPASAWATLTEIAESPIDVGPYMITGWEKGIQMTFEANPYWSGPAVKTPKIVISFITAENAEAQLLGGNVDLLDSTTLTALSQTLADAQAAGTIVVEVVPSGTWEHVDIQLFLK